jgi:hypothetical protein
LLQIRLSKHPLRGTYKQPLSTTTNALKKSVLKIMNKANNITDRSRSNQESNSLDRRLARLEETQLTSKEVKLLFDRMAEKIDILAEQIDRQFDWLEARCDRLESRCQELDRQLDLAISKSPDRVSRFND